jgi:hypothetical protein
MGFHRNENFNVTPDPGLAGQTKPLAVLFLRDLWGLGALDFSFFDFYPAFSAEGLPAAGSLDIDSRLHRRLEQVLSCGNLNFSVMRLKSNEHWVRQKDWLLLYYYFIAVRGRRG